MTPDLDQRFSRKVLWLIWWAKLTWWRKDVMAPLLKSDSIPFAAAAAVLREFGGLWMGYSASGIDCARTDVLLDPSSANGYEGDISWLEGHLKRKLFALGTIHRSEFALVIDEDGKVYCLYDELIPIAPTFDRALELLLLGKRLKDEELASAGMTKTELPDSFNSPN